MKGKKMVVAIIMLLVMSISNGVFAGYFVGEGITDLVKQQGISMVLNDVTIDIEKEKVTNEFILQNTGREERVEAFSIPIASQVAEMTVENVVIKINKTQVEPKIEEKDNKMYYTIATKLGAGEYKKISIQYQVADLKNAPKIEYLLENFGIETKCKKLLVKIVVPERDVPLVTKIKPANYTFEDNIIRFEYENSTITDLNRHFVVEKEIYEEKLFQEKQIKGTYERTKVFGLSREEFLIKVQGLLDSNFKNWVRDGIALNFQDTKNTRQIITNLLLENKISPTYTYLDGTGKEQADDYTIGETFTKLFNYVILRQWMKENRQDLIKQYFHDTVETIQAENTTKTNDSTTAQQNVTPAQNANGANNMVNGTNNAVGVNTQANTAGTNIQVTTQENTQTTNQIGNTVTNTQTNTNNTANNQGQQTNEGEKDNTVTTPTTQTKTGILATFTKQPLVQEYIRKNCEFEGLELRNLVIVIDVPNIQREMYRYEQNIAEGSTITTSQLQATTLTKLYEQIQKEEGIEKILYIPGNSTLPEEKRAEFANNIGADVYIRLQIKELEEQSNNTLRENLKIPFLVINEWGANFNSGKTIVTHAAENTYQDSAARIKQVVEEGAASIQKNDYDIDVQQRKVEQELRTIEQNLKPEEIIDVATVLPEEQKDANQKDSILTIVFIGIVIAIILCVTLIIIGVVRQKKK